MASYLTKSFLFVVPVVLMSSWLVFGADTTDTNNNTDSEETPESLAPCLLEDITPQDEMYDWVAGSVIVIQGRFVRRTSLCSQTELPELKLCIQTDDGEPDCGSLWELVHEMQDDTIVVATPDLIEGRHHVQLYLAGHDRFANYHSQSHVALNMTTVRIGDVHWWEGFSPWHKRFGYPTDDFGSLVIESMFGESGHESLKHSNWATVEYFERTSHHSQPLWRMNTFLGPTDPDIVTQKWKSLVVTFAGRHRMQQINDTLSQFAEAHFDIWLFCFDDTPWSEFSWFHRTTTVVISAQKKMKWWYIKRFLRSVNVIDDYEYVLLLDDDAEFSFDPQKFVEEMARLNVLLGQPVHAAESVTTHEILYATSEQMDALKGIWTNFVECGPFVAIHTLIWPCIQSLLQSDLVSGYGYDLVWVPTCAPVNSAILYDFKLIHMDTKGASNKPNFHARCMAEGLTLFARLRHGPQPGQTNLSCHPDYELKSIAPCQFTTRREHPFVLEQTDPQWCTLPKPIFPIQKAVAVGAIGRNKSLGLNEMVDHLRTLQLPNPYSV